MAIVKRYRKQLLVAFAFLQLGYLLALPATRTAFVLLGRAWADPKYTLNVLLAPVLLAAGILFNQRLKALHRRWLEWSLFGTKANLALKPITFRWIWVPYGLMLAACMPLLAFFEELLFRNGTSDWVRGLLWGGLAFGVVHLVSFVTVRMTIYLSLVGVVFVGLYMSGGLVAVFVTHATYNLLALSLITAEQHLSKAPGIFRRVMHSVAAANS